MKIKQGNIRIMREEFAAKGTPKDTDEIRITIPLEGASGIQTFHPANETQNAHKHLIAKEAVYVEQGSIEAYTTKTDEWVRLEENDLVEFEIGEYHNVRSPANAPYIDHPRVRGKKVVAVSMCTKYLPAGLDMDAALGRLVLDNDWFGENYAKDQTDKKSSPALRLEGQAHRDFWSIVERNREILK